MFCNDSFMPSIFCQIWFPSLTSCYSVLGNNTKISIWSVQAWNVELIGFNNNDIILHLIADSSTKPQRCTPFTTSSLSSSLPTPAWLWQHRRGEPETPDVSELCLFVLNKMTLFLQRCRAWRWTPQLCQRHGYLHGHGLLSCLCSSLPLINLVDEKSTS